MALVAVVVFFAAWAVSYLLARRLSGAWLVLAYLCGIVAGGITTLGMVALMFYLEDPQTPRVAAPGVVLSLLVPLYGVWSGRRKAKSVTS